MHDTTAPPTHPVVRPRAVGWAIGLMLLGGFASLLEMGLWLVAIRESDRAALAAERRRYAESGGADVIDAAGTYDELMPFFVGMIAVLAIAWLALVLCGLATLRQRPAGRIAAWLLGALMVTGSLAAAGFGLVTALDKYDGDGPLWSALAATSAALASVVAVLAGLVLLAFPATNRWLRG